MSAEDLFKEASAQAAKAAADLGENFDAVVILASRAEGGWGTRTVAKGSGNWHAQLGLVREWLLNAEEGCRIRTREENDRAT